MPKKITSPRTNRTPKSGIRRAGELIRPMIYLMAISGILLIGMIIYAAIKNHIDASAALGFWLVLSLASLIISSLYVALKIRSTKDRINVFHHQINTFIKQEAEASLKRILTEKSKEDFRLAHKCALGMPADLDSMFKNILHTKEYKAAKKKFVNRRVDTMVMLLSVTSLILATAAIVLSVPHLSHVIPQYASIIVYIASGILSLIPFITIFALNANSARLEQNVFSEERPGQEVINLRDKIIELSEKTPTAHMIRSLSIKSEAVIARKVRADKAATNVVNKLIAEYESSSDDESRDSNSSGHKQSSSRGSLSTTTSDHPSTYINKLSRSAQKLNSQSPDISP